MKTRTFTLMAALLLGLARFSPAADSLNETLQKGLFEEEANHNLEAAIKAYQAVVQHTDEQRKLAATAIFRLGECYRKLGRTNDATAQYERILRELSDQTTLADFSRQNLLAVGAASPAAAKTGELAAATDDEEKEVQRIKALIKDSPDLINSGSGPEAKTPLHKAAQAGQLVVARFLLANKANVDARADRNATPLHYAAVAGHKSMVELLLANGAKVNASGGWELGGTPLHFATKYGFKSVAEVLIANKADLEARNDSGQTPLDVAAEWGQKQAAELLLAKGADINAKSTSGWTPLHYGVKRNDPALVDLFLSRKADVNAKDKVGMSALSWAVDKGNAEIAEKLLENEGDPNVMGAAGEPLLHVAIARQSPKTLKLLLAHKPELEILYHGGLTPLQVAVRENVPVELIHLLLAAGAKANAPYRAMEGGRQNLNTPANANVDITDFTPLMVAILKGSLKVVEELLANGADVNATSQEGDTALHYAVSRGSLPIVEAILARHPDTEIRTKYANTPIINATSQDPKIMEALINAGADVNVKGYEDKTALHYAVEKHALAMVTTILAHHPDTEIRDNVGFTPLRRVQFQDLKIMEALIRAGADLNSVASDGNSLLHDAVRARRKDIVELLVTNKADVNVMNKEGESPLMWTQMKEPPGRALRVPPPPGAPPAEPAEYASLDEIATYLLRHGADESIPRRSFISVSRKERNLAHKVFFKGTNSFNRYTLFEAMAGAYPKQYYAGQPILAFPDFANVKIRRLSAQPGANLDVSVDLAKIFDSGECNGDLDLEWGDVVEIPELDHGVSETWPGLAPEKIIMLRKCLKREVEIVVKGEHNKVTLEPAMQRSSAKSIPSFRLKEVINLANVLRLSSDLTRVKVKRAEARTGKAQEFVFNLTEGAPYDWRTDLWLRDGDVIEIPEK